MYTFPLLWLALLIVSFLKFNLSYVTPYRSSCALTCCAPTLLTLTAAVSFVPIVVLALVFNVTNAIGFTYACAPVLRSLSRLSHADVPSTALQRPRRQGKVGQPPRVLRLEHGHGRPRRADPDGRGQEQRRPLPRVKYAGLAAHSHRYSCTHLIFSLARTHSRSSFRARTVKGQDRGRMEVLVEFLSALRSGIDEGAYMHKDLNSQSDTEEELRKPNGGKYARETGNMSGGLRRTRCDIIQPGELQWCDDVGSQSIHTEGGK